MGFSNLKMKIYPAVSSTGAGFCDNRTLLYAVAGFNKDLAVTGIDTGVTITVVNDHGFTESSEVLGIKNDFAGAGSLDLRWRYAHREEP